MVSSHKNRGDYGSLPCGGFRGKGDYFRLGHGTDSHVRKPQVVDTLKGKKIVHVAVGALHCLAVTDQGQVRDGVTSSFLSSLFLLYV